MTIPEPWLAVAAAGRACFCRLVWSPSYRSQLCSLRRRAILTAATPIRRSRSGSTACAAARDRVARTPTDVDWESKDGHYRVRLDGAWIDVPDEAVVTEPNRAGRAMVWPIKSYMGVTIRCFMPGSMT